MMRRPRAGRSAAPRRGNCPDRRRHRGTASSAARVGRTTPGRPPPPPGPSHWVIVFWVGDELFYSETLHNNTYIKRQHTPGREKERKNGMGVTHRHLSGSKHLVPIVRDDGDVSPVWGSASTSCLRLRTWRQVRAALRQWRSLRRQMENPIANRHPSPIAQIE